MTELIVTILSLSLIVIFCVRHFFVQIIALKLLLDAMVFTLCSVHIPGKEEVFFNASAWLVAAVGTLVFFILTASGARRFARNSSLSLEENND